MKLSLRRAEMLALAAFLLQVFFFFLSQWIAMGSNSAAVRVEAWHFLGGAVIWLILLLQFRQRRLAQEERQDAEQFERLRREGKDTSVFESATVEGALHLAERRLAWLEKYLLPVFAFLMSGYLLGIGYWLFHSLRGAPVKVLAGHEVLLGSAAYLAIAAVISFLFSRYAVGMSQQSEWRPLRAGGSYLLSNALACFALAVILLVVDAGYRGVEPVVAYILIVLMIVIGVEILLNLILDAYRPRLKGEYRRAAYESRLLGLFSEPGGLLRTAAHAIDYQFGFRVSETWFYKLLERAVLPLLVLQALVLYFMSCLTIVQPGNQAVLERFGVPQNVNQPYQSGIHLKFPWPIDMIRSFPVQQVKFIDVGFERFETEDEAKPELWTVSHWKQEFPFIVAVPEAYRRTTSLDANTVSLSPVVVAENRSSLLPEDIAQPALARSDFDLVVMALTIHYRIEDVAQYAYGDNYCYQDPHELLESLCYHEAVQLAARSDLEKLLGPGRHKTTESLREAIQQQVNKHELGVKILFVGLESVHPPITVAESFEKVVSALQDKQAKVLKAQGEARELLANAQGQDVILKSAAEAYAFRRSRMAQATGDRFASQLEAYQKGGQVYQWREYLSVLEEFMPSLRKYVIASSNVNRWVYEMDLKEKLQPDLFEGLGIPEKK
jgi:modulator of FtsH protease HflK